MRAEVISAKAIRFSDVDNEEHTVLAEDIEECCIERHGKRLAYFVGLPNWPCLTEIDKDTYNIFVESMEECLGNASEKIGMKTEKSISKEIKFIDIDSGWEYTALPENIDGLGIEQYDGSLEYYANISDKGFTNNIGLKTYNILLAALKAVANAKEKDDDQNKEKKEKK